MSHPTHMLHVYQIYLYIDIGDDNIDRLKYFIKQTMSHGLSYELLRIYLKFIVIVRLRNFRNFLYKLYLIV